MGVRAIIAAILGMVENGQEITVREVREASGEPFSSNVGTVMRKMQCLESDKGVYTVKRERNPAKIGIRACGGCERIGENTAGCPIIEKEQLEG